MRWIKKMDDSFFDGLDELYRHAKSGEHRTTRVGCSCVFVCLVFFFVGHAPSPEHCAVQRCIVRTKALRCRLLPDFDAVFSLFSHGIAISDTLHSSHFCHCGVRWRHNTAPNLEPRSLVNFVPVSGRIAWPIMHRFGHFF